MRRRLHDLSAIATLALLVLLLYRKVLRLWWTYDDANMLRMIIHHEVPAWFFDGSVWPQKLFTPMVMVAFEADLAAFGLAPERWFVIHLLFVIASAIALFFALRAWFTPWVACAGAALYVASVPLCSLTTELSGIHYFMAVILGSLATLLCVHAVRSSRTLLTVLSALVYLVGMLAKETVAPLLLLLIVLPERDLRTRIRLAIPHALTLAFYMLWRRAVIGTFLGGYGWAVEGREWLTLFLSLPKKIVLASAGFHVVLGVMLIALMLVGVAIAMARKQGAIVFIVAMALATGPILPVSKEMQRRYALVPWLVWSIAFVAGADILRRRHPRAAAALLTVVPLLAVVVNRQEWGYEYGRTLRMSDEARFFFEMPPDSYLRLPTIPPAALGELNWLKTEHLKKPFGALWFYDDYYLCKNDLAGKRAWQYEPAQRAIVEITAQLPGIAKRHCAAIRRDAPLTADFDYRKGSLFWRFGPYEEGRYRVLLGDGGQAFDVPRVDGFRLPDLPGLTLRVRYDAPAGWTTYSDEIALDFKGRPRTSWRR